MVDQQVEPFEQLVERVFSEHAEVVGSIAITWNGLMSECGKIFHHLSGLQTVEAAQAIWNAPKNDATLRDMLLAIATLAYEVKQPKRYRDIRWLIVEQFDKYRGHRDSAVHSPYAIYLSEKGLVVEPDTFHGNKLARKLKEIDLERDLTIYLENLRALRGFANGIAAALAWPNESDWPVKPALKPISRESNTAPQ